VKGKTWIVARREFLSTVLRPGWLSGTFGMPVFVGLYAGLIFLITHAAVKMDRPTGKAGIVDLSGLVKVESGPVTAAEIPDEALAAFEGASKMADGAGPAGSKTKLTLAPDVTPDRFLAAALAAGVSITRFEAHPISIEEIFVHVATSGAGAAA